jgi:hypothetical protein
VILVEELQACMSSKPVIAYTAKFIFIIPFLRVELGPGQFTCD